MSAFHEGGCLCGSVRYRVKGDPVRGSVCHCTYCQRRTGSAFGVGVYFRDEDVELSGERKVYEHRSDESGRWLRNEFCPRCGVTVSWTLELSPGLRGVGGGTFDDPKWFRIERHGWRRSGHAWTAPPAGVETFEESALSPTK